MATVITKTRTVGGVKWECSESEGLWFSGEYRIGRCDRKGRSGSWELFKNNESKWIAKTCGDLMDMVARKQV